MEGLCGPTPHQPFMTPAHRRDLGLPHQRSKNGRASLEEMLPAAGSTHESWDPDSQHQRGHADPHGIHLAQDRRPV